MAWYDWFSSFYDSSLEKLYRDARASALTALDVRPGMRVLDLPCGTGASFDGLVPAVGDGRVVGADLSKGMLRKAAGRVAKHGWTQVDTLQADVQALDVGMIPGGPVDRLHVFLGMSTFPDPDAAFERLWACLKPGGRAVVVDVFSEKLTFQGRMVNWIARADIRRRSWEPLEKRAQGFERRDLPSLKKHGGTLFLATGTKA